MGVLTKVLGGISIAGISVASYVTVDIHRYKVYPDQSLGDAAKHYMSVRTLAFVGRLMRSKLDEATLDVKGAQRQFLLQQIKDNLDTEYSKDYKLNEVKSVKDFLKNHPLTRYEHYSRYIARMLSGEKKVLTSKEPIVYAVTSGTSGDSHIIPMVMKQTKIFFLEGISILFDSMIEAFPETKYLNKDFKIFFTPNWRYSVDGTPIGPNSASPERSKDLFHLYTTPPPAYEVRSEPEALYLYLLFALLDRKCGMIEANFASMVFNAFATLEFNLAQLTEDIEKGCIRPDLDIEPSVRERLEALMKPDPARAQEIRDAAALGREGLALRIWPELHIALGADTGTFELYGDKLRSGYCKGVPLYSPIYAASEGLLGVNIWPQARPSRYLLHPKTQFFEFIPDYLMDEEQPKTRLMHQVQEGNMYELVITNPSCLYRYRFGDVVKVVGFHNQCPVVEFKYRKGQFLNVRGEKVSEAVFYETLKGAITKVWSNMKLVDYCCTESVVMEDMDVSKKYKTTKPCYHVFLEVEGSDKKTVETLTNAQKKMLDDALMVHHYPYSSFRAKGSIAPIQVHLVTPGSFMKLRRFMLDQTLAAANQYKVPRVLRKREAVQFMLDRVINK